MLDKSKLKLSSYKGTIGYTMHNIKEVFDPKTFAEFEKWIYGQTVAEYKGDNLVYYYDLDRFLAGLPAID